LCWAVFSLLASAHLVLGQSGGASITLQPVAPKTVPPSDYPPGTTIVGQEIILGSVPARVWFEIHVTGWAPDDLKLVQAKIDYEQGLLGSNALCNEVPSGGASLGFAITPCGTSSDCRASISGMMGPCIRGEPSSCAGSHCSPGFQNFCDSSWIGTGVEYIGAIDCCHGGYRFGAAAFAGNSLQDFHPSYLGTWVLDVPNNAKGIYTIGFVNSDTFLLNGNPPPKNVVPIATLIPGKITVPCGRCCSGVATNATGCVEGVSANECATYTPSAVFQANEDCPDNGGPSCPVCALDEHCDDGLYCNGAEVCEATGACGPGESPCEVYEACEENTDSCVPRIPTVNVWGMIALGLLLLIVAKLRYRLMT